MVELRDRVVVVVGRGSGIARAVALAARDAGARVVVAGRDRQKLADAYQGEAGVTAETVDLTDEASIAALAERLRAGGGVDHVVSTGSVRAKGRVADLDRETLRLSFDTKVIGPIMLAKHLAPLVARDGSFVLFSGVSAVKTRVDWLGVATTNGAVDSLTRSLALELAPIRVNAISPGTVDSGAWDGLGAEGKAELFDTLRATLPARRVGGTEDIAHGVLVALTNSVLTGVTLHIAGGEPLT